MPAKVTLKVIEGKLQGQEFVFDERTTCIIGRAKDCRPQVPDDDDHQTISRYHCLLDIDPPDIRVRDFGSLNGTCVNGVKIGQRLEGKTPAEGQQQSFPEHDLKDGDTIKLVDTTFRVGIFVPARCIECSVEIPAAQATACQRSPGVYQCAACRKLAEAVQHKAPPQPKPKVCAKCGRDVSREIGQQRQGEFVCAACQADPVQILKRLLELAKAGDQNLLAIQGYQILKELGKGGMGAVYLARHDRTGEQVALKVMLPRVAVEQKARDGFLLETLNTRALKHRHVVELRDSGCSQGTFFFTLEFCDGGSVDQLMKQRGGKLSLAEATEIALQTLEGLDYAHNLELQVKLADGSRTTARGLVHRDLKPHNIFLTGSGSSRHAKVGDFGLGKAFDVAGLSGRTCTGSLAGTPVFMPRQQVINFKYAKPEVDVWAMAASLYFMLTGRFPRDFTPGKDVWQTVLQTNAVPIRQRDASIPKKLAEVIDAALVDKPNIQIKTAEEFKRALEGAV